MTEPPNPLDVIGQLRRTSSMTSNVYPYLAGWQRDAIVAAAALIAAQAAEIEKLKQNLSDTEDGETHFKLAYEKVDADNARLRAEIERLRDLIDRMKAGARALAETEPK